MHRTLSFKCFPNPLVLESFRSDGAASQSVWSSVYHSPVLLFSAVKLCHMSPLQHCICMPCLSPYLVYLVPLSYDPIPSHFVRLSSSYVLFWSIHSTSIYLLQSCVFRQYFYCYPDCPSYLPNLNNISWTTLAIRAVMKKYSFNVHLSSVFMCSLSVCVCSTSHSSVSGPAVQLHQSSPTTSPCACLPAISLLSSK